MPLRPPAGVTRLSQLHIDADVDWGGHSILNAGLEAVRLVLERRTDDPPGDIEEGRLWLRTDL